MEDILIFFYKYIARDLAVVPYRRNTLNPGYDELPRVKMTMAAVSERLANGWTPEEIIKALNEFKMSGIRCVSISELIPSFPITRESSLDYNVIPSSVGRHSELKNVTPIAYNKAGEKVGAGSVSLKSSYTINDMCDYYIKLNGAGSPRKEIGRVIKQALIRGLSPDAVLYAIDMVHMYEDNPSPWDIMRYVSSAVV